MRADCRRLVARLAFVNGVLGTFEIKQNISGIGLPDISDVVPYSCAGHLVPHVAAVKTPYSVTSFYGAINNGSLYCPLLDRWTYCPLTTGSPYVTDVKEAALCVEHPLGLLLLFL